MCGWLIVFSGPWLGDGSGAPSPAGPSLDGSRVPLGSTPPMTPRPDERRRAGEEGANENRTTMKQKETEWCG